MFRLGSIHIKTVVCSASPSKQAAAAASDASTSVTHLVMGVCHGWKEAMGKGGSQQHHCL